MRRNLSNVNDEIILERRDANIFKMDANMSNEGGYWRVGKETLMVFLMSGEVIRGVSVRLDD